MLKLKHITFELIDNNKQNLINFSNITEENIRDIWFTNGDVYIDDLTLLEYHWSIPLYQKMIFRYRNSDKLASKFFRGCDPYNQMILLRKFHMYHENKDLIDFFSWISTSLGVYDIVQLEGLEFNDENLDESKYVKSWKKNDIEFFFSLSEDNKNYLIEKFNTECVDKYNEMGLI